MLLEIRKRIDIVLRMVVNAIVEDIRFGKVLHPVEYLADEQPGQEQEEHEKCLHSLRTFAVYAV